MAAITTNLSNIAIAQQSPIPLTTKQQTEIDEELAVAVEETPVGAQAAQLDQMLLNESGRAVIPPGSQSPIPMAGEPTTSDDVELAQEAAMEAIQTDTEGGETKQSLIPANATLMDMRLNPEPVQMPIAPTALSTYAQNRKSNIQQDVRSSKAVDSLNLPLMLMEMYYRPIENKFYEPDIDHGTWFDQALTAGQEYAAGRAVDNEGSGLNRLQTAFSEISAPANANLAGINAAIQAPSGERFPAYLAAGKAAWEEATGLEYGEDLPSYGMQIVETIAPNANPVAKFGAGMLLEVVGDPLAFVGAPVLKVFQLGMRKLGEVGGASRVMQDGVQTLADALIAKGTKSGLKEGDRGTLTTLAKLARAVDDAPDMANKRIALKKLEDELNHNPDVIQAIRQADEEDLLKKAKIYEEMFTGRGENATTVTKIDNAADPIDPVKENLSLHDQVLPGTAKIEIKLGGIDENTPVDLLTQIQEMVRKETQLAGTTQTQKDTITKARTLLLSDLIGKPAASFSASESAALILGLEAVSNKMHELANVFLKNSTPENLLAVDKAYALYDLLMNKAAGAASEFGRGLQLQTLLDSAPLTRVREIDELMQLGDIDNLNLENLSDAKLYFIEALAQTKDPRMAAALHRQLPWNKQVSGTIMFTLNNSAISAPSTFMNAIYGNISTFFMAPTRDVLAGMSYAAIGNFKQAATEFKVAGSHLNGWMQAFGESAKLAFTKTEWEDLGKPARIGQIHEAAENNLRYKPSAETYGWDPEKPWGRAADIFGSTMGSFGDTMGKIDKSSKLFNVNASINEQAIRIAMAASEDPATQRQLIATLKKSPTHQMWQNAIHIADTNTFMKKLTGSLDNINKAQRHIITAPFTMFFKTAANLATWGIKHSTLGDAWRILQGDLNSTNIRKRDFARTQIALGSAIPGVMTMMLGDSITGHIDYSTPEGQMQKALGVKEYSIRTPWKTDEGKTISFDFGDIPPLRITLGMWVNARNAFTSMRAVGVGTEEPNPYLQDLASAVVMGTMQSVTDAFFLGQVGSIVNMIEGLNSGNQDYFNKQVNRMLATFAVPSMISSVNQTFLDRSAREAETLSEFIMSRTPILSEWLEPKVTPWGQDQIRADTIGIEYANQFLTAHSGMDDYDREIIELGVNLTRPEREKLVNGYRVQLSIKQRTAWARIRGQGIKQLGVPPIKEEMVQLMTSRTYNSSTVTDRQRKEQLQDMWNTRSAKAFEFLMKIDPSIEETAKKEKARQDIEDLNSKARQRAIGEPL